MPVDPIASTTSWLTNSRPQRVEMMHHLCAAEHFIIDGDSLLVEALLNEHCDWQLTQPLHVVYLAESILARYRRFGAQFTVCFFQQNSWWWTRRPQFELARTLLLQRLIAVADQANSKFSVAVFQDYTSKKFEPFLAHIRPEFAMVTDGCQFDQLLDASVAASAAACIRAFSMYLSSIRLHIAFTSRQDVRNNAVYVFSVRASIELQASTAFVEELLKAVSAGYTEQFNSAQVRPRPVAPTQDAAQRVLQDAQKKKLTARDALVHLTLSTMLADKTIAADAEIVTFAKVHLLCNTVQNLLPLAKRALNGGKSVIAKKYLDLFSFYAKPVAFGLPTIVPPTALADEYADSVDGHLFARVAQLCQNGGDAEIKALFGGDAVLQSVAEAWTLITEVAGLSAGNKFLPLAKIPTKIYDEEPAAPTPAAENVIANVQSRNIPLVKTLLGADAAKANWSDVMLPFKASGWKQLLPGGPLCEKMDEYKEVENFSQDMLTKFVRDQRESGQSMNVKRVELTGVIGKGGDDQEEHKVSQSSLKLQLENSLNKETAAVGLIYHRSLTLARESKNGTLSQKAVRSFLEDAAEDSTPTPDEFDKFRAYLVAKKLTENDFLFKEIMTKNSEGKEVPSLAKIQELDVKIKLAAFVVFRRHCILRVSQLWLERLWGEWDVELRAANDDGRLPNMNVLVNFFLELQVFMNKLSSFKVVLDSKTLSLITAMVATLNFGESYQNLILDEISRTLPNGGTFRPEPVSLPNSTELDLILKKFSTWCSARFQLCVMGELLERPRGIPDKRMPFPLDPWQKKLLDAVDDGYSAVVTAPTSSGKTFIALYAMTKVLKESNEDVVIYVCPTRALVNQALGDTWARFGHKEYGKPGCVVVGVLGGDGYVTLPFNCQVLVTLPEVLEVILMSPIHQKWAQRIKFVVFDEIHSIEDGPNGAIWERLMMAVKCPFVALSATLGNTDELTGWLNRTRAAIPDSKPVIIVPGPGDAKIDRFNDIEKHICLAEPAAVTTIGKPPAGYDFDRIHPLSCIGFEMLRSKGVEDLRLVPSEVVELYDALQCAINSERLSVFAQSPSGIRVIQSLAVLEPGKYFAGKRIITKQETRRYEDAVVRTLCNWAEVADTVDASVLVSGLDPDVRIPLAAEDHKRFYEMVQGVLDFFGSRITQKENKLVTAAESKDKDADGLPYIHPESFEYVKAQLLPLLITLHERQMTPSIAFTFTEEDCEDVVDAMVATLENAELNFRNSPAFEDWVAEEKLKFEAAQQETANQAGAATHTARKTDADGNVVHEVVENTTELKEYVVPEVLPMFSFKPRFSRVKPSDWQQFIRTVEGQGLKENIVKALKRGIAVHHNGIGGKIRRLIERMFRQLAVPVIVATETLALGVHSPCKTCVIAGDNVRLTTSQFRQMSGRAGRRGEDFLGHCIFLGVPLRRIQRLLTSDLDRLKGHITIDATTILRLESLLNFSPELMKASVEQLVRQLYAEPLVIEGRSRVPANTFDKFTSLFSRSVLNWAAETGFITSTNGQISTTGAIVTRVVTTLREVHAGPGAFLFAFLLASGAIHSATAHFPQDSQDCVKALYQLCSLLFSVNCNYNTPLEIHESALGLIPKATGNEAGGACRHAVVLPSWKELLGGALAEPVAKYNRRVLQCAVDALRATNDTCKIVASVGQQLPLSQGTAFSGLAGNAEWEKNEAAKKIAAFANGNVEVRNPFSALSGATDAFSNAEDLCRNLRDGLFMDVQMLPTLDLADSGRHDGRPALMNAACCDYLVYGYQNIGGRPSRQHLFEYNGLSPQDSWYTLILHFKAMNSIIDFLGKDWAVAPGGIEKVENQEIFNTDDHVMDALLSYQDRLTELGSSIYFQSASVTQFAKALKEAEKANKKAKRIQKNKK